jgi:protein-S-isoprenylcysteine O-methyltransferase Ste14
MSRVWRNVGRFLLDHESKLFAAVLGLLAADQWLTLGTRARDYWVYLANGIYGSPLLSLLVTALSAIYMSVIVFILLGAGRPLARYETLMPNLSAAIGGFGIYLFSVLTPAATPLLGIYSPLTLLAAGVAIVLWALCYLRRAFSVVPQARSVVERGPYRFVRHPMYVGNMLTIVGLGLIVSTPPAFYLSLACLALQFARAHYEDRLLASTFNEYGAYMSRVNAFLPRLSSRRIVQVAAIVSATVIASSGAGIRVEAAGQSRAEMAAKCQAWHRKALAGEWFTEQEASEYAGTDGNQEGLESISACKEFFALADTCQAAAIDVITSEPEDKGRPSADYIKANEDLVKIVEQVPGCKSIAGFNYVCPALRMQARRGKSLSPKLKSMLGECANVSIGKTTSGLIRGAL